MRIRLRLLLTLFVASSVSCGNVSSSNHQLKEVKGVKAKKYSQERAEALLIRKKLKAEYDKASNKNTIITKTSYAIDSLIYHQLIPHWKGTAWTFSGHTDTPQQGTVACGYFVSTTLKHVGFNLNRYKLAQAASKQAGEVLVGKGNLKVITGTPKKLKEYMLKNSKPGLYFLGLDFHEAYLWLTEKELYIVHSNYIGNAGVMQEKATESSALAASKSFWFAPIGGTKLLAKKWLLNSKVN